MSVWLSVGGGQQGGVGPRVKRGFKAWGCRMGLVWGRRGHSGRWHTLGAPGWMEVMQAGSTRGLGRRADSSIRLCHWRGSPVNFCSCWSKPVCTRCSKLDGAEISTLFFFFPNMAALMLSAPQGRRLGLLSAGLWEGATHQNPPISLGSLGSAPVLSLLISSLVSLPPQVA